MKASETFERYDGKVRECCNYAVRSSKSFMENADTNKRQADGKAELVLRDQLTKDLKEFCDEVDEVSFYAKQKAYITSNLLTFIFLVATAVFAILFSLVNPYFILAALVTALLSLLAALGVLAAASFFTMYYTKHITKSLEELTEAAEQVDKGNYNIALDYSGNDEVGRLTSTFKRLTAHMKENITALNRRAYIDALTSVRNKWAYASFIDDLQTCLDADDGNMQFAVGVFDCDDLKVINDKYGHDKGDIYLKTASSLMCRIFKRSPVFRIGGDEFSVIFQNDAFQDRDGLIREFRNAMAEVNASADNPWEQVRVSFGIAEYDAEQDGAIIDVVRRADKNMYENKRTRKTGVREGDES